MYAGVGNFDACRAGRVIALITPSILNILVVEDDEYIAELLGTVLTHEGFAYEHAINGREAMNYFDDNAPVDLVLLDIIMPYADGSHVLKSLRANPQWRDVPVIMLPDLSQQESIKQLLAEGANAAMAKPIDPDKLITLISKVIAA